MNPQRIDKETKERTSVETSGYPGAESNYNPYIAQKKKGYEEEDDEKKATDH